MMRMRTIVAWGVLVLVLTGFSLAVAQEAPAEPTPVATGDQPADLEALAGEVELLLVGYGRGEVVGDELGELVEPVGQLALGPFADLTVEGGSIALGQRLVGHVADEHVPEAVLAGLRQRRGLALDDEVLHAQAAEALADGVETVADEVHQRQVPEDATDDGGDLGRELLTARERVEPGSQDGLDRVGHLDLVEGTS